MNEQLRAAVLRRCVDITASSIGLILMSPFLLVIGLCIRRGSPGPAIFRQTRIGRHGKPFTLYKFRTMHSGQAGSSVTAEGDSRITPLGARLRATKVDELPQLLNVLTGQMSLVGPRPEVPEYVYRWPAKERHLILSSKPGITDPVTYQLRAEETLLAGRDDPETFYIQEVLPWKARSYAAYLSRRSLTQDLVTLFRTLGALLGSERR